MFRIFGRAGAFNQDLSTWCVDNVSDNENYDFNTNAWNGSGLGNDASGRTEGAADWGRPLWGASCSN